MNDINLQWFFDYLDSLPENSPSRIALTNMFVAWEKHLEEKEKMLTIRQYTTCGNLSAT